LDKPLYVKNRRLVVSNKQQINWKKSKNQPENLEMDCKVRICPKKTSATVI